MLNPDVSIPGFEPYIPNGHLQTLLANFWKRPVTEVRFPIRRRVYDTEPGVRVAVDEQFPALKPVAHAVLVHGLEGSSQSGYIRSLSRDLLEAGYAVHRLNMRSCGGTEDLAPSNYHSGQTSDARAVLETIQRECPGVPLFLVGFSLGGNMSLKLAGELGENGGGLLTAVCAVSTPIDLAACSRKIGAGENVLYERRFLRALRSRIERRHAQFPDRFKLEPLRDVRTIWDFDHAYTAKEFEFGTAENYYRTQSANGYLHRIGVPALLIQAKDDPMIPFDVYSHPAIAANPFLRLVVFEHGGHVGFVSRQQPRFWIDPILTDWIEKNRTTWQVRNVEGTQTPSVAYLSRRL